MGGFANEGDPVPRDALGRLDRERKHAAAGLDGQPPQYRVGATLELIAKRRSVKPAQTICHPRGNDADQARPQARQWHEGEWTLFGVELG